MPSSRTKRLSRCQEQFLPLPKERYWLQVPQNLAFYCWDRGLPCNLKTLTMRMSKIPAIKDRKTTVTTSKRLTSSSNQNDSISFNNCQLDRKSSTVAVAREWIPKDFPGWATTSQPSICPSVS